jgi:hypothetical protein
MVVCGFEMPEAFMQLFEAIQRREAPDSWVPKDPEESDLGGLVFIAVISRNYDR